VCYQLVVVSALTLSEVRSMLPSGVRADVLDTNRLSDFRRLFRGAQTAAHLRVGQCACRLVPDRFRDSHTDEAELRTRYRRLAVPREAVIAALDRHRRGAFDAELVPAGTLHSFVAEHARNAGPALYALGFGVEDDLPPAPETCVDRQLAETRDGDAWLVEDGAVRVSR
jgi:hypothetical protein